MVQILKPGCIAVWDTIWEDLGGEEVIIRKHEMRTSIEVRMVPFLEMRRKVH